MQLRKITAKHLKRFLTPEEITRIKDSVTKVSDPENPFRTLIIRRAVDYAEEVILAAHEYHAAVPSTLTSVMYEVAYLVNGFHRVVLHNRHCFEEIYRDIIDSRSQPPVYPEENDWCWDNALLHTLKKLRCRITSPEEADRMEREFSQYRLKQFCEIDPTDEVCLSRSEMQITEEETHQNNHPQKTTSFTRGTDEEYPLRKPKYDMKMASVHGYMDRVDSHIETTSEEEEAVEHEKRRSTLKDNSKLETEKNAFKHFCMDCTDCFTTVEPVLLRR